MELTTSYLLKFSLCLLALYLFYYALLRRQSNFGFNRLYLLLVTPVALIIPLIKWPEAFATEAAVLQGFRVIQLPAITLTAADTSVSPTLANLLWNYITFEHLLLVIYLIGTVFLLYKLCRQLVNIRRLMVMATPASEQQKNITILEISEHTPTFAFLNYIFMSHQNHLSNSEKKQVLEHEMAHVQLRHTIDILYYEVLTALLWFNPVVWLLKNELRDVHEFQADARVLQKHHITQYSSLLAKEVLYNTGIPLGSYFKEPQVLKRLQMLRSYGKRSGWVRPVLMFPLLGTLTFLFSSQQLSATIQAAVSAKKPFIQTEEKSAMPVDKVEPEVNSALTLTEPVKVATAPTISSEQLPEKKEVPQPAPITSEPKFVSPETTRPDEKPYTYVEKMPEYIGGDDALLKFFKNSMVYPESAKNTGKEGMVIIIFTVGTDGELSDFDLLKGISQEIDMEAMRLIKLTDGKWIAGSQNGRAVPVRYTIPINFKLTN